MNAWIVVVVVLIVAAAITALVVMRRRRQPRPPTIGLLDLGALTADGSKDDGASDANAGTATAEDRASWSSDHSVIESRQRPPRR